MKKVHLVILLFVTVIFSNCTAKKGSYSYYENKILKLSALTEDYNYNEEEISYYNYLAEAKDTGAVAEEKLKKAKLTSDASQKENSRIVNEMMMLRREIPDSILYKLEKIDLEIISWADYYIDAHNKK